MVETVKEYLDSLPSDRREEIEKVRKVILKNLPKGYEEGIQYGIIGYYVPLNKYPAGYLGKKDQPLPFASLANRKNNLMVSFFGLYIDRKIMDWFLKEYKKTGKKLDMGKSCIYFRKAEDLPLGVIGKAVAKTSVNDFIRMYEDSRK